MALPHSAEGARQIAARRTGTRSPPDDRRRRSAHRQGSLPRPALSRIIASRSTRESAVALVDRGWPDTGWVTGHRATPVFAGFRFPREMIPVRGALVSGLRPVLPGRRGAEHLGGPWPQVAKGDEPRVPGRRGPVLDHDRPAPARQVPADL